MRAAPAWVLAAGVTARFKTRRRQVDTTLAVVSAWTRSQGDVRGLALVGSYAYGRPRMGSDLDLVLLTTDTDRYTARTDWMSSVDPRARLIRTRTWGSLTERRLRLRGGLHAEVGVVTPASASLPLDPGTARVLRDGCRALHDPDGLLRAALQSLRDPAL